MPPRGWKKEELRKNAPTNFTIKSAKQVNAFFFLRPNKFINFTPTHFLLCIFFLRKLRVAADEEKRKRKSDICTFLFPPLPTASRAISSSFL